MNDDISMDGLFSSHVAIACGVPGEVAEELFPSEQSSIEQAVEKRRSEFIAGRALARRALRELGIEDVAIPVGEKREPVWPQGFSGSIAHTRGFCGVAVARQSDVRGLGFDVERICDVSAELRSHIVTDAELQALHNAIGGTVERALALAFSAKESFYKFQFPLSRQWISLLDVELRADSGGFSAIPAIALHHACACGEPIRGKYVFQGDFVLTGIEVAAK